MAGNNVLTNPGMTGSLTGWSVTAPAGSTIVYNNGAAVMDRVSAQPSLAQGAKLSIGNQWEMLLQVSEITGSLNFGANEGAGILTVTQTGLHRKVYTPTTSTSFVINLLTNGGHARIEWASARRMDVDMSKAVLTLRDYDGDKKQTSMEFGPVTDGTSYTTRAAEGAAFRDAVNAVAGNIAAYDFVALNTEPNDTNAASPVFQTHVRWIVELTDSVTGDGPYAFDIPTADLGTAALFLPNTNEHDPAHAAWIALKAAINGKGINPRTGSTWSVGRIYLEE